MKAALRAIPILKEAGITAKIINMQPYKDPDEFIKALGAEAYQERIDNAENSFMFELRILEKQYDMQDPEGKTAFYNEAAKKLCGFTEKLERDNYIDAVARKYMLAAEDLRKLVNRTGMQIGLAKDMRGGGQGSGDAAAAGGMRPETGGAGRGRKRGDGMRQSQKLLLTWLIEAPVLFEKIGRYITPEDFTEELYGRVAEQLFAQYQNTGEVNPARIVSMFENEEEQREIAELFNARIHEVETKEDREKALRETIVRVKENGIKCRGDALDPADMEGLMKLVQEKKALEELKKLHIVMDEIPDLRTK